MGRKFVPPGREYCFLDAAGFVTHIPGIRLVSIAVSHCWREVVLVAPEYRKHLENRGLCSYVKKNPSRSLADEYEGVPSGLQVPGSCRFSRLESRRTEAVA